MCSSRVTSVRLHPSTAPGRRRPCQSLTSRHLVQAQRRSHAAWNRAARTLPVLLWGDNWRSAQTLRRPFRGAPHCSPDPAQGALNMQGNQDPLGTVAKGFGHSTQNSTHTAQFLWTNSQGSVFMWEQVSEEEVQCGHSSRGDRPSEDKADQERIEGRTPPAGHSGVSALVPDYGVWSNCHSHRRFKWPQSGSKMELTGRTSGPEVLLTSRVPEPRDPRAPQKPLTAAPVLLRLFQVEFLGLKTRIQADKTTPPPLHRPTLRANSLPPQSKLPRAGRVAEAQVATHSVLSPRAPSLQTQKAFLSCPRWWWAQASACRRRSRLCTAACWRHVDHDFCRRCRSAWSTACGRRDWKGHRGGSREARKSPGHEQ